MDKNVFKDIIKLAKIKEEGSYNTYIAFAKKVKNPIAKKIFKKLAEEEKGHAKFFENLNIGDVKNFEEREINDLKLSKFLVDVDFNENISMQDTLLYAIKREDYAVDFYDALANLAFDDDVKKMLQLFKAEEMRHKKQLEEIYESNSYQFF